MSDKFWAVWRKTGGGAPQKRHDTKEEAVEEAGRLVKQTGEAYYIPEVTGIVRPTYAPVEHVEI
jgi:hypothetical protein